MVDNIQNLKRSSVVNVIFSIQFIAKMLYLVFSLQKIWWKSLASF